MGFIKSLVISIQSSKGFIVHIRTVPGRRFRPSNPSLSFCDEEPPAEVFTIPIVESNSLADVGMYAGVSPHAILKFSSSY